MKELGSAWVELPEGRREARLWIDDAAPDWIRAEVPDLYPGVVGSGRSTEAALVDLKRHAEAKALGEVEAGLGRDEVLEARSSKARRRKA